MTDKEKLTAIKAEIERLRHDWPKVISDGEKNHLWMYFRGLNRIRDFIDSLLKEPAKQPVDETMAEIEEKAKAFTESHKGESAEDILRQMQGKEPVSEDLPHIRHRDTLDEFAYQCAYDLSNDWAKETPTWHDVEMACKLGSNWKKEQMMKDAIDLKINRDTLYDLKPIIHEKYLDYKIGDKVKVIIVKEE